MVVNLTPGTRPEFSMAPEDFRTQVENGEFWGIPLEYFEVTMGRVYLEERLARKIDWQVDAHQGEYVNLNAPAQVVHIDGRELKIPAGFFCSYVDQCDIVGL